MTPRMLLRFRSGRAATAAATLLALSLLPLFALSGFNHPFMDDYYNAAAVREQGWAAVQLDLYRHWTGRFFSSAVLTGLNPLRWAWYGGFRLTPALALLAVWGTAYLGLRTLTAGRLPRGRALGLGAVLLLVYAQYIREPYSAFYWFTGAAVYVGGGLLVLVAFAAARRAQLATAAGARAGWAVAAAGAAVAASGSSELAWLHVLLGAAAGLAVAWARGQRRRAWAWLALLGLTLAAGAAVVGAPGNLVRLQAEGLAATSPGGESWPAARLWQALPQTLRSTKDFLLLPGFWFRTLPVALLWAPVVYRWRRRGWLPAGLRLPAAAAWAGWLGLVVASMGLFAATLRDFPPLRALNGLQLVLLPLTLLLLAATLPTTPPWRRPLPAGLRRWALPAYLAALLAFSLPRRAWVELLRNAAAYDRQLQAREALYRGAWGRGVADLAVPPLRGLRPQHVLVTDWDLTADPGYYVNYETARYFGLRTLRVDSAAAVGP